MLLRSGISLFERGEKIDAERLNRALREIDAAAYLTGPQLMNTGMGRHLRAQPVQSAVTNLFWAKLLKWQEHGKNTRYAYEWKEVAWLKSTNDDIFDVPNGLHGEVANNTYAINVIEQQNVARPGKQGNSIDETRSGFPATFFLQPAGGGKTQATQAGLVNCANQVVVLMHTVTLYRSNGSGGYEPSGTIGYQFAYENAHDGACG